MKNDRLRRITDSADAFDVMRGAHAIGTVEQAWTEPGEPARWILTIGGLQVGPGPVDRSGSSAATFPTARDALGWLRSQED